MAEALSLAASVIAVVDITAKVTGASIKLVNLWKEIKNVPDALLEKAERLKDFEDFLLETEIQAINSPIPQQAWNSALLQKYIARTRTVLKDLQENVDRLHTQVTDPRRFKRKLASTRTVLRKEDLSVLDSRLDVALELFKLAREQYLTQVIHLIDRSTTRLTIVFYPWALELLQLPIFDEDDIDDVSSALIEMSRYGLDDFLEGPEAFDYSLEPGNDQISFRILLKALVMFGDQLSSRELRLLLPETESLTIAILESSRMDYRFSLFRSLAIGMVYQAMDRLDGFEPESGSGIAWYRLLGTILELDPASLHHLEKLPYVLYDKSQTAFSQLVSMIPGWARDPHSLTGARKEAYYRRIHRGMDAWLDALLSNQVDLLSYGRRERGLYKGGHSIIQQKWVSFSSHPDPPIRLRLHGITFGPSKEHWRFWWADEYEEYAGDFWAMIKDKEFEMRIPGSWEDEYDADGRYYPEWNRLWDWEAEEPLPLIWSEYRKAQMPM
ncbi:hypothetical protein CFIO01_12278 [Colletotrichum fioriniae PJ7]|uniref:NACHT-NTPase and P-loop NTPases N-terminal domain-containing protein n=1 Tax=Colletotrichum fioriniae PJ7 TaxID=1445577 RepID=A0A010QCP4_9PEZI|nr:hypothetical protein CFIO01_12278 [Colletotrichum fioriniae PJ7]